MVQSVGPVKRNKNINFAVSLVVDGIAWLQDRETKYVVTVVKLFLNLMTVSTSLLAR
jgi:hypothetical protein